MYIVKYNTNMSGDSKNFVFEDHVELKVTKYIVLTFLIVFDVLPKDRRKHNTIYTTG